MRLQRVVNFCLKLGTLETLPSLVLESCNVQTPVVASSYSVCSDNVRCTATLGCVMWPKPEALAGPGVYGYTVLYIMV